jgi:hypothetical protein
MIKKTNEEGQTEGNNVKQTNYSNKERIIVTNKNGYKKCHEERMKTLHTQQNRTERETKKGEKERQEERN